VYAETNYMKNLDILVVYRMNNILKIRFDARIKEGLIRRDTLYKPTMSSPNAYKAYNNLYFISFVLINNQDLNKAIGMELNNQERQLVFLNVREFNSYIKYLKGREDLPKITQEERDEPGGIIEKNINYLLQLFFGNKASFYLGDKEYTIQSYEWDRVFNYVNQSAEIKLRFLLTEGKDSGFMQSVGVSCAQKWDSIKADYAFLMGFKADPNKSKEENEKAKQEWKDTYAMKEIDAPYTMQPTMRKKSPDYLRSKSKLYTPTSTDSATVQAAKIQAQTRLAVEKMKAEERKRERLYEQKKQEEAKKKEKEQQEKITNEINDAKAKQQKISQTLKEYNEKKTFIDDKMKSYKAEQDRKIKSAKTKKETKSLQGNLNKKMALIDNLDNKMRSLKSVQNLDPTRDYEKINNTEINNKYQKAKSLLDDLVKKPWGDFDKKRQPPRSVKNKPPKSGGYKKRTLKRKI